MEANPVPTSDVSSLDSVEEAELRREIHERLDEGFHMLTDRLRLVRMEIAELERQQDESYVESSMLAFGGTGDERSNFSDDSASGLRRSSACEALSTLETISESGEDVVPPPGETGHVTVDSPDEEYYTPVGGEDENPGDSTRAAVRFDLPSTPLTRTDSIRCGRAGRYRILVTPYRNVKRVLNPEGDGIESEHLPEQDQQDPPDDVSDEVLEDHPDHLVGLGHQEIQGDPAPVGEEPDCDEDQLDHLVELDHQELPGDPDLVGAEPDPQTGSDGSS